MALQSMTGFARHEGQYDDVSWVWELRSVNGKGLDLRFRLPSGFEAVESAARKSAQTSLSRGNIQISLQTRQNSSNLVPVVNEPVLETIIEVAEKLTKKVGGELPSAADLLNIRGVVEFEEASRSKEEQNALETAMVKSFEQALASLLEARIAEGSAVGEVLKTQIEKIASLRKKIDADGARSPEAIGTKLKAQLAKLIAESDGLDPQRLHQEAALLAAKADVQEELDRLAVHLESASDLLKGSGPLGRKLDFLSQEFNRECNTICSKSNSASVSSLGLDMKLVIDQFREQVQNME